MIVDVHTHLMWYPDHIADRFAEEALASKRVKLARSGGEAYAARLDKHSYDARPDDHWKACAGADKVVVFGLQARAVGVWVPNEVVADYVRLHPEKLEGWASVDPNDRDCVEKLDYAVRELGLKGLKLGPAYQHFDPQDRRHRPIFQKCCDLGIPILWHQGATFANQARLKWASPLQLEDVAMEFPDLRMIIAHLGHPWEEEAIVLIRKCPNLFADISACHYRPWRFWHALVTAVEYGVEHKLLLASDFPSGTIENVINGLRGVNRLVEGTSLPQVPREVQDRIIQENWKGFFRCQ